MSKYVKTLKFFGLTFLSRKVSSEKCCKNSPLAIISDNHSAFGVRRIDGYGRESGAIAFFCGRYFLLQGAIETNIMCIGFGAAGFIS